MGCCLAKCLTGIEMDDTKCCNYTYTNFFYKAPPSEKDREGGSDQ